MSNQNALQAAMAAKANKKVVTNVEDLEEGGKDWSLSFLDPQPGESYLVKFLMNLSPEQDNLVHRSKYGKLPDPKRKGKTFNYVSSGNANSCEALELFFDLHALKKDGDILAEQKIEKYLGRSRQGACLVQILSAPKVEDVGKVRIFVFASAGQNAKITQLLGEKLNPTESQIKAGFAEERIFDLTPTATMMIECQEADYDGVKGRDYSKSIWGKKERGMCLFDDAGNIKYEFKAGDIDPITYEVKPEIEAHFTEAVKILQDPNIDMLNQYSYKSPTSEYLTEDVQKYVAETFEKVKTVIPIIRDAKSMGEIEQKLGGVSNSNNDSDAETIGDAKASDILAQSIPELEGNTTSTGETNTQETQSTVDSVLDQAMSGDVQQSNTDDIEDSVI